MFLRRAGIHLLFLPTSGTVAPTCSSATTTAAAVISSAVADDHFPRIPFLNSSRTTSDWPLLCSSINLYQSHQRRLYHYCSRQQPVADNHLQSVPVQLSGKGYNSKINTSRNDRLNSVNLSWRLQQLRNFSSKKSSGGGVSASDGGNEGELVVTIKNGLSSRESAENFLGQLSEHQKQLIYHTLNIEILRDKYEGSLGSSHEESHHYLSKFGRPATMEDPTGTLCEVDDKWLYQRLDEKALPVSAAAIWAVTLKNALPFIGFGFLDNLIMILAGDYIDLTIGTALGISTMAAAALGNAISDVAGIGSAWYVESIANRIGIKDPVLTPSQMASWSVRWACNFGRAFGVLFGCILGMFPLLFLPSAEEAKERKERRAEEEQKVKEAAKSNKDPADNKARFK